MKVDLSFYKREDVCLIARELLGKILATNVDGQITRGVIVETEAYSEDERACHAYGGKMTKRTELLFKDGGVTYVYLIYGMYELFNIVTNRKGRGEAVLIRSLEPAKESLEIMKIRRNFPEKSYALTSGPGKLSKACGISRVHNGISLCKDTIWLEHGRKVQSDEIVAGPRINVGYAGEDALLPWRFYLRDNPWVSKK